MKIALIGYGKMGKIIEKVALSRGHDVVCRIDIDNQNDFESDAFKSADVAIEFTAPTAAINNYRRAWKAGVAVVSGTTGWTSQLPEIKDEIAKNGYTLFWSSNFSLGVNLFFELNKHLAKLMNQFPAYNVTMKEVHHIHKLDAPSGTALTLVDGIISNLDRKDKWTLGTTATPNEIAIEALREGEVAGIHTVRYESDADSIEITHSAKNREGFALGSVIAAEFVCGKKGFLTMNDLLKF